MSVETKPNKLVKGLVLDTFHTDVDNTVATYALNAQLEDQEGNHFHYGSEVQKEVGEKGRERKGG